MSRPARHCAHAAAIRLGSDGPGGLGERLLRSLGRPRRRRAVPRRPRRARHGGVPHRPDEEGFGLWARAHRASLHAGDMRGPRGSGTGSRSAWPSRATSPAREDGWTGPARARRRGGGVRGAGSPGVRGGDVRHPRDRVTSPAPPPASARADDGGPLRGPGADTLARIGLGRCRIYLGEVAEGLRLLDEAMVAVEGREVSPVAVGDSYCTVIDACRELFDLPGFEGWTEWFTRWLGPRPDWRSTAGTAPPPGRAHAPPGRLGRRHDRGRPGGQPLGPAAGTSSAWAARTTCGRRCIRLRGEFGAADDDYRRAHEHGCEPQPGLALLRLGQGAPISPRQPSAGSRPGDRDPSSGHACWAPFAEIVLADGDVGPPVRPPTSWRRSRGSRGPSTCAAACTCAGRVLLAGGEARSALVSRAGHGDSWNELDAARGGAHPRAVAQACRALGDGESADLESSRAATFEALGARPDADGWRPRRRRPATGPGPALGQGGRGPRGSPRRHEPGHRRHLRISERTVASHVSHIFTKIGLSSRAAATAYAYEHRLVERGRTVATRIGSDAGTEHV